MPGLARILYAMAPIVVAGVMTGAGTTTADADESSDPGQLMLVLDSSGSMKEPAEGGVKKIDAAKEALGKVIGGLPANQPVGLRVYGAEVFDRSDKGACTDTQRVVDLGTDNRDELQSSVDKYKPYGETPIGNALKAAGDDLGSEGRRSIVLVSDGEATCSPDPCKVAASLSENGIDITIDVVGLDVSGTARQQLRCIADEGDGTYYDADDADDLTAALDTMSERAALPHEAIGTPVEGGQDADDAAEIAAGDWKDTLGGADSSTSERWYTFTRTIPKSTLHISATIANQSGEDALHVNVYAGKTECGYAQDNAPATYRPFLAAALATPGFRESDENCADADEVTIEVARGLPDLGGYAKNTDVPLEIRVIEEPPAGNADQLPAEGDEQEEKKPDMTDPSPIVGGNTFGNAVEIEPGAYSGTLVPGEAQLFKVDADWGQRVNSALQFPKPTGKLADAIGILGPQTNLWIYSPSRANASSSSHGTQQNGLSSSIPTELDGHTYQIAYNNRARMVDPQVAAALAGEYYISVAITQNEGEHDDYEVPFTLGVDLEGKANGEPVYDGGEPTIGGATSDDDVSSDASSGSEDSGSSDDTANAAESSDSSVPWLPIGLGVAGLVLLAGGTFAVRAARRT